VTQEALKLALEALETPWNARYVDGCDLALGKRVKAIPIIKEALAQTQEPKIGCVNHDCDKCKAQRTWVDLTDEDISEIVRGTHNTGSFVRAIEAKLKEKNT
jgi:hypothetical protein